MANFRFLDFDQLAKELDKYKYKQLHIHHTWKPTHKSFKGNNHLQMQQSMYNYHTKTNGWGNIAQHLTLFPDGKWLTGRPFNSTPISIKGWNTGSLAVEMIGNFDKPGTQPFNDLGYDVLKGDQKGEILKLIRYFVDKYGESSVKFHRDNPTAGKTCPGTSLDKTTLIREAKALNINNKVKVSVLGRIVELNGYFKDNTNYVEVKIGNKTEFLPIRALAESIGLVVGWDNVNKIVTLK